MDLLNFPSDFHWKCVKEMELKTMLYARVSIRPEFNRISSQVNKPNGGTENFHKNIACQRYYIQCVCIEAFFMPRNGIAVTHG